jgi:hypothetical protein
MSLLQQCHRLLDELSAGTQLCPTNILSDATLNQCKEWQSVNTNSNTSQYNCTNDKYLLESLQPGQYQGIVASYLSFNTDVATSHFHSRAALFEQCTGGKIQFAEGNDISVSFVYATDADINFNRVSLHTMLAHKGGPDYGFGIDIEYWSRIA